MQFISRRIILAAALLYLAPSLDFVECGIAGLHKWFRSKFPQAVQVIHKKDVVEADHLLFDLNQLLHQVTDVH